MLLGETTMNNKIPMIILYVLCRIFVLTFLRQEEKEKYVNAVIFKGLASLCFVILGFINSNNSSLARLIVIGLIFGFVADILLNLRHVFKEKGKLIFLVGILVFLIGHIIYLIAIFPLTNNPILCVGISIVLTALLMMWIFTKITAEKAFKIFGVVYIGAIVLLNVVAIANMFLMPPFNINFTRVFALGAALFLISDIVLILNTFGSETRQSLRYTNIELYYNGQILIAISLLCL